MNCSAGCTAIEDEETDDFALMQVSSATTRSTGDDMVRPGCAQDELSADVIERLSLIRSTTSTRLVQSHGLFETSVGTRSFTLQDLTPDSFVQQVRGTWPEFPNQMRIHFVWPQPQDFTPGLHFVVEFLPDGELPHHSIVPTLEETVVWSPFGMPDIQRQALYHTRTLQHADVTNPFSDLCHRARFFCTVRALGRVLPVDAKMNIMSGALVQLHAHPPALREPPEFVDFFRGMDPFFVDSLRLLEETFTPSIIWRFHLLLPEGYQGVAETQAPISHSASASAVADCAFAHWNMDLPGALVYAGQPSLGSTVLNFIAFDPDSVGAPCLLQADIDDQLGLPSPPPVAASLSSVCTLQEIVTALGAVWVFDVIGVQITVWDGTLLFDADDRFKPKPGTTYTVLIQQSEAEIVSTLQVLRAVRQSSNLRDPRPSRAPGLSDQRSSSRPSSSVLPSQVAPTEPEPEDGPGDDDDPDDEDAPDEEDPESEDVTYHRAHIYHLQDDYFSMDIDEVTMDSTVDQISDHWQLAYGELVAAHVVASPPSDHENGNDEVLIAELRQDIDTRPLQTDILALVDIEFKLPLGSALAVHWRKVLWLRSTSTRAGVLHQLRSFDLCHHRPNFACVVFLNNAHWPDTDTAIRHFINGDYLRLVVICPADTTPRDAAADLRAFERAEIARRVFCAEGSSSSSPRGSTPSVQGSVTVTSEPDDPAAVDCLSPHVLDRWCGDGGSAACSWESNPSQQVPTLRPLIDFGFELTFSCEWKRKLATKSFVSPQVESLRDFLLALPPWPMSAFSNDWLAIPDAHEYVGLINIFQPAICDVGEFHIFLDGSHFPSDNSGAWAFTVLLRSAAGDYFRWGFTGGYIEGCGGSLHAEAIAFAHTLDWIITNLLNSVRPVHIYGDATAIGYGADGSQKIATGLNDVGIAVRHMFCLAQSALPSIDYHHVKAHCGQIDNELVDSLAKAIAKQTWSPHAGIPSLDRWTAEPLMPWAWLLVENVCSTGSSLPQLDDLAARRAFPGVPQGDFDPFGSFPEISANNATARQVNLRLGSANVRSLKEGVEQGGFKDKVELISAQIRKHGYDVFAIQESRGREDRVAVTYGITRLVSAALCGQGGVELWFNPNGSLAEAGCGPLDTSHFHILSSSPTWLIADCDHPLLQCIFAVAYAPQSGRDTLDIDQWWESFKKALLPFKCKDLVLMGDLNAHLGSVETTGIGGLAWSDENTAGTHLRSLLEDHNICLPATFSHLHSGTSVTFRSASGGQSRVDYIGLPESWVPGVKRSSVDVEFDLLSGDFDHFAVSVNLGMSLQPSSSVVRPRRAIYDRKAAKADPDKLRAMLESLPVVPWGIAADQHWHIIEKHCSRFLRYNFPLPKRQVRQEYFSDETWTLLNARKVVEIQIKAADRRIADDVLYCAFIGWKSLTATQQTVCEEPLPVYELRQERAMLLWVRGQLDSRFRSQRKSDLVNFRVSCSLNFSNQVRSGDTSALYKALKPKRPVNRDKGFNVPKPLPALALSEEDYCEHTRRRYLRVWETHFAKVEHSELGQQA